MRLSMILSLCLIVSLAAPASFAAELAAPKPADKPAAKPAKPAAPAVPTVEKPEPFAWPLTKSWYDEGEDARAVQAAKLLGRPIAMAWYVDGKRRGPVKKLKGAAVLQFFVGLTVADKQVKQGDEVVTVRTSKFLKKVLEKKADLQPPCLAIVTWEGEFIGKFDDVRDEKRKERFERAKKAYADCKAAKAPHEAEINKLRKGEAPYDKQTSTQRSDQVKVRRKAIKDAERARDATIRALRGEWVRSVNAAIKPLAKQRGRPMKKSVARTGWKSLMGARKLWHAGDYDGAMRLYRNVAPPAETNPDVELAKELKKDLAAINYRGSQALVAPDELYGQGELDKAETEVRKVFGTDKGFDTATEAKALFDKIRAAQAEKTVAAKTNKDPVPDPPKKPKPDDKKDDKDDDKKDDGDDDKNGGWDDDFEEDF